MSFTVRESCDHDVEDIRAIYAHHVLHGLASFEEAPPDAAEVGRRRAEVLALRLPYLVAEAEGRVVGYCYATLYRTRSAYRHTLENSVYVREGMQGRGIGRALLEALIERCEAGPWRQMVAVIGDSANEASIALHRACGFEAIGTLRSVGFKFGHWVDSVFMQRALGRGDSALPG